MALLPPMLSLAQDHPTSPPANPPTIRQPRAVPLPPTPSHVPPPAGSTGTPPATAPSPGVSGVVQEIRIEGSQRIEPSTVRSYLTIQPGDPFDSAKMDESLKALFATGLFADVQLRRDGNTLIVRVIENPIINRVAFEGNSKIDDKQLN